MELILVSRKPVRVAHEWKTPFYVVKLDIEKAFDSVEQRGQGEQVMRKIAQQGEMPFYNERKNSTSTSTVKKCLLRKQAAYAGVARTAL